MKRRLPWSTEEIENWVSRQHGSLDLLLNKNRNQGAIKQIAPLPHAILRRVKKYMEEHLQDKLSMDELARETDYSRAHFLRMFRTATGKTPHQYLTERRIERAKSMLLEARKISLIDVAARCGFSSQSHLTRVFRKQVSTTPTEFKRKPEFKNLV
jgi:AraC family transcriptional regulator